MGLATLKLAITLAMLVHASYKDLKTREIELGLWAAYGAPLAFITGVELLGGASNAAITVYLAGIAFTACLTLPLYFLNIFGGADVICLLLLSLTTPSLPLRGEVFLPPSMLIIFYSVLFTMFISLYFLAVNLREGNHKHLKGLSVHKRALLLLVGIPMKAEALARKRFWYPLQRPWSGETRLYFDVNEDDRELRKAIEEQIEKGELQADSLIWSTYGVPTIPFILLGYVAANLVGDTVIRLLMEYF